MTAEAVPRALVKGRVVFGGGGPAQGLVIVVYDRDLRAELLLGEAETDTSGHYEVSYEVAVEGEDVPDLEFRVFAKSGGALPATFPRKDLVEIDGRFVLFNAGDEEEVDIVVLPDGVDLSRYELVVADIARQVDGDEFARLTSTDVKFLHHDTGHPVDEIAFAIADARLRRRVGFPEGVFFALALHGLGVVTNDELGVPSIDLAAVLECGLEEFTSAVYEAINAREVPENLRSRIGTIGQKFEAAKATNQDESREQQRGRLSRLGVVGGLEDNAASALADRLSDMAPTDGTWRQLIDEGFLGEGQIADVRFAFDLGTLTRNNTQLVETLKSRVDRLVGKTANSTRDLAELTAEDWSSIVASEDIPIPPGHDRDSYAQMLAWEVERRHPHEVFVARTVRTDRSLLRDRIETSQPALESLGATFAGLASHPGAHIGLTSDSEDDELHKLIAFSNRFSHLGVPEVMDRTDLSFAEKAEEIENRVGALEAFFEINPDLDLRSADLVGLVPADFDGEDRPQYLPRYGDIAEAVRPRVRSQLMAYQRALALAPNSDATARLLEAGYDSAHSVAQIPLSDFMASVDLPAAMATGIHTQAIFETDRASFVAGSFLPLLPGVSVGTAVDNVEPSLVNRLAELDSYEDLFGSQASCDCAHCHSMFGPLAYFVDLIAFAENSLLRPTFAADPNHPLHLRKRRPDLWDELPLSCSSATNLIPYLEIVNEVLTDYVGRVEGLQPVGDESMEDAVFAMFRTGDTSFQQPVDVALEEIRQGLDRLNLDLPEVVAAAGGDEQALVRAWLGLSHEEFHTIIESIADDDGALRRRYGLSNESDLTALGVEDLMAASGLSRDELGRLSELDFIDAGGAGIRIDIVREEGDIQPSREVVRGLNGSRLDRIFRFVRLWRAVSWTMGELDHVISVLERQGRSHGIDGDCLSGVTVFLRLQNEFDLSVAQVCALIDEIPTRAIESAKPSLYDQLFNKDVFVELGGVFNWADPPLFHHPHFDASSSAVSSTDAALPRILSGLGMSEESFVDLMSHLRGPLNPTALTPDGGGSPQMHIELNVQNLSLLYRHALIADRFGISVDDLFGAMGLIQDRVPAFLGDELDLFSLQDFVGWVGGAGLTIDEVGFVVDSRSSSGERVFEPGALSTFLEAGAARVVFTPAVFADIPGLESSQLRRLMQDLVSGDVVEETVEGNFRLTEAYESMSVPQLADEHLESLRDVIVGTLNRFVPEFHAAEMLSDTLDITHSQLRAINAVVTGNSISGERAIDRTQGILLTSSETPEDDMGFLSRIEELAFVAKSLSVSDETLDLMSRHPAVFGVRAGDTHPINQESLRDLCRYLHLLSRYEGKHESLSILVTDEALTEDFESIDDTARERLARQLGDFTGVSVELARSFLGNISTPSRPIEAVDALVRALDAAESLGTSGAGLAQFRSIAISDLRGARDTVYSALHARYPDEDEQRAALEPLEELIRDFKRDILVSHILARPELEFEDTHDLYHYFLLDPEMDGCAMTSRVGAATASLQLYIHRSLMHLEQSAGDGDAGSVQVSPVEAERDRVRLEWEWRKNYRVWEANRKVFLYPENYLEPDLRDNKTPPFTELEERLLQEDLDEQAAERLYRGYLDRYSEVADLSIAGAFFEPLSSGSTVGTVFIVGRAHSQPARFYLRTQEDEQWSAWERIELEINAEEVSPVFYLNRLYLFWVERVAKPRHERDRDGESVFKGYLHKITLKFSSKTAEGSWTPPQEVALPAELREVDDPIQDRRSPWIADTFAPRHQRAFHPSHFERRRGTRVPGPRDDYVLNSPLYNRIFPFVAEGDLFFRYRKADSDYRLDLRLRRAVATDTGPVVAPSTYYGGVEVGALRLDYARDQLLKPEAFEGSRVNMFLVQRQPVDLARLYYESERDRTELFNENHRFSEPLGHVPFGSRVQTVNNAPHLWILEHDGGSALLRRTGPRTVSAQLLHTRVAEDLQEHIFGHGVWSMLHTETQMGLREDDLIGGQEFQEAPIKTSTIDVFRGDHTYKTYNWEVFFHAPLLIANTLNAQGRFEEAERWYNVVFDPSGEEFGRSEKDKLYHPNDHNWRFVGLHELDIPKLRDLLDASSDSYRAYREDPFNPHAVARLRPTAYQRGVVMKYVDNLLDWGDDLFARDTRESINEAVLLYTTSADILGRRPLQLGRCETPATGTTYSSLETDGGFIVAFENLIQSVFANRPTTFSLGDRRFGGGLPAVSEDPGSAVSSLGVFGGWMPPFEEAGAFSLRGHVPVTAMLANPAALAFATDISRGDVEEAPGIHISGLAGRLVPFTPDIPAFCVPQNDDLLKYWDRVEDRIYKIRHCMSIDGVRRSLALFAPPIDPALLVRARAAGLTLEEVLAADSGGLPPYRFSYLIGKAKEYVSTLRGLGGALLAALEKKDAEELAQLRSVHQQNIQRMTKRIRQSQIEMARESVRGLQDQRDRVEVRLEQLKGRLDQGWSMWETASVNLSGAALTFHIAAATAAALVPPAKTVPQVEAGTSGLGPHTTAGYGPEQVAGSAQAAAQVLRDVTTGLNMGAGIASTLGTLDRRVEEWSHQQELAAMELEQLEKDIAAAEIRVALAERELEVHEELMDQAEQVYDFYRTRFTSLGLYTWLASQVKGLYRQAYRMALDMARMAETAYRYERDEPEIFIDASVWDAEHAGLLAGEKLMLQLQGMERSYLESNERTYELNQTFSLAQLDPSALNRLKELGSCDFVISEPFFDIVYPGQFGRRIKSVRLTIPCVTGPYTNVNAKLTMLQAHVRHDPSSDLVAEARSRNVSIATSQAQNDGGVFELSFRDERYVPFEGAGAVSEWRLELPGTFRAFDYNTISDVLVHVSYTAAEDGAFRELVEGNMRTVLNGIAEDQGLSRGLSLGQEFATEFHSLFRDHENGQQSVTVHIGHRHFPYFLHAERLKLQSLIVGLRLRERWASHLEEDDELPISLTISWAESEETEQGTLRIRNGVEGFDGRLPHVTLDVSRANATIGTSHVVADLGIATADLLDLYTKIRGAAGVEDDDSEPMPGDLREIIEDIYVIVTVKLEGPIGHENP